MYEGENLMSDANNELFDLLQNYDEPSTKEAYERYLPVAESLSYKDIMTSIPTEVPICLEAGLALSKIATEEESPFMMIRSR